MIIDRAVHAAMIEHMRQAVPLEGCGLLAGPRTPFDHVPHRYRSDVLTVDRWVPLANVAEFPRLRFEVEPEELIEAWNSLDAEQRRPWVVCHSHPTDTSALSRHDIRYATDPTLLHAVVSLAAREPVVGLWYVQSDGEVRRVVFEVVGLGFQANTPTDLTHGVSGG